MFEDNVIQQLWPVGHRDFDPGLGNANTSTRDVVVRCNHIKGNKDCFAPEIYGGRYVGITVIYNAPGTTLENILIQKNLIEDQIYNGMTVTGGDGLCISDNEIRRCNLGIFHGIARDQTYRLRLPPEPHRRLHRRASAPTAASTTARRASATT